MALRGVSSLGFVKPKLCHGQDHKLDVYQTKSSTGDDSPSCSCQKLYSRRTKSVRFPEITRIGCALPPALAGPRFCYSGRYVCGICGVVSLDRSEEHTSALQSH